MRPPSDIPQIPRPPTRRRRWIIAVVIVLIILFASLRTFAVFYTDALWFSSVNLHSVWLKLFEIKAGLMVTFAVIFAILLMASLLVAERLAPKGPTLDAEDEFVKRYQEVIGPYARWLRVGVVVVLSLIVGSQAIGQWKNWILFRNSTPFDATDPQFHRNVGYFVMTLPFEQFLVHWALVALFLVLLVTVLSHYLNGGIRMQGSRPRVRPAVKAHISVILGLLALVKAVGYYLARFNLDLSSNGYVQGAGYTDVHARLPALELLILVSLAAAVLLIYNIRRQGWALPILGVGLWFLVALTAGTIYPAAVQALKVNPSQNTLERPYIQRNIDATRTAMGINNVQSVPYPATSTLTASELSANSDTLANVRLWDPTQTQQTFDKLQDLRTQYQFNSLGCGPLQGQRAGDPGGRRRPRDQRERPPVLFVGEHHAAVHPRLRHDHLAGQHRHQPRRPRFAVGGVPPVSNSGLPDDHPALGLLRAQQRRVCGGQHQTAGDRTTSSPTGPTPRPTTRATGGCSSRTSSIQAMFAIRFSDFNLLISNQITSQSRLMFDRGVQARVSKAAPFLSLDSDPYPGLARRPDLLGPGRLHHHRQLSLCPERRHHCAPRQQRAQPELQLRAQLGEGADQRLHRQDDLLRDGPQRSDHPDLREGVPRHVHPGVEDEPRLKAHLRYPEDIFTVQAAMYGKYHITKPPSFYSAADAWALSPSPGSGSPSQALQTTFTTNAQGEEVSTGQLVRWRPSTRSCKVPGQAQQSFNLLDAFVPISGQSQIQTLSGFMIAGSDPGHYGKLEMFVTPRNNPVNGPAIVAAQIDATASVSSKISC